MKRIAVVSGAAVVLLAGAGIPVYMGYQAQSALSAAHRYQHADLEIVHEIRRYRNGYANSSADAIITVSKGGESIQLAASHNIEHLWLPRIETSYRLLPEGSEFQKSLHAAVGDEPVLFTDARQTFDGLIVALNMPAREGVLEGEQGRFRFDGMTGAATTVGDRLSGKLQFNPLRIDGEDEGKFELGTQQVRFDIENTRDLLSPGSFAYNLDRVNLRARDERFDLNRVQIEQTQTASGASVNGDVSIEIGSIETGTGSLSDLSIRINVGSLHRDLLEFLFQASRSTADDTDAATAAREDITPLVARFLEHSPEANLRVALGRDANTQGTVNWSLAYRHSPETPVDPVVLENLLGGVDSKAVATFKQSAIEALLRLSGDDIASSDDITATLAEWEAEGLLARDGDDYRLTLAFSDGMVLVNEVPRPELLLMLGMMLAL